MEEEAPELELSPEELARLRAPLVTPEQRLAAAAEAKSAEPAPRRVTRSQARAPAIPVPATASEVFAQIEEEARREVEEAERSRLQRQQSRRIVEDEPSPSSSILISSGSRPALELEEVFAVQREREKQLQRQSSLEFRRSPFGDITSLGTPSATVVEDEDDIKEHLLPSRPTRSRRPAVAQPGIVRFGLERKEAEPAGPAEAEAEAEGEFKFREVSPADQIQALEGVQDRLDDLKLPDLEVPGVYTTRAVTNSVLRHVNDRGDLRDASPQGKEQFARDLTNVLTRGIVAARQLNKPEALIQALGTAYTAVNNLTVDGEPFHRNPEVLVELVDQIYLTLLPKEALDQAQDIDIDRDIDIIFGRDLDTLTQRQLSESERRAIRREFNADITRRVRPLAQFEELRAWVLEHVADPTLQRMLTGDINVKIRQLQTNAFLGQRATTVLNPIRGARSISITEPVLGEFTRQIQQVSNQLATERKDPDGATDRDLLARALATIDETNALLTRESVTDGRGAPVQLPRRPRTLTQAIEVLNTFASSLGVATSQYGFVPTLAEGVDPASARQQLLQKFQAGIAKVEIGQKRLTADIVTDPHRVHQIGAITLNLDHTNNVTEIVIPPETLFGDVAKLAKLLSMEGGTLSDHTGNKTLTIKKRMTVGPIVSFIQKAVRGAAGHTLRLMHMPAAMVGGAFLGPLRHMVAGPVTMAKMSAPGTRIAKLKHALLRTPIKDMHKFGVGVGGAVKLSGVAAGVASVAGIASAIPGLAVVTAPVAAVASVVGAIGKLFGL